jgi:hypothetical protein
MAEMLFNSSLKHRYLIKRSIFMNIIKIYTNQNENLRNGYYQLIELTIIVSMAFSFTLLGLPEVRAEVLTPKAFVYTEVQNSVPFREVPWEKRNQEISAQSGFIYKTWLSGLGNNSVGGIYAFDSIDNAKKYVINFFPNGVRKQGTGHTTRIFNASIVEKASRGMESVDFGGNISSKPGAFVYTELQVNIPFAKVPWRQRNPVLKKTPGLLTKTWLSGIHTNTIGGIYAFDTIQNAKHYALELFPKTATKMNASSYVRIFDAHVVEEASRGMHSPYFR